MFLLLSFPTQPLLSSPGEPPAALAAAAARAAAEGTASGLDRARALWQQAVDGFVAVGDPGSAAGALLEFAATLTNRGDPREAIVLCRRAGSLADAAGDGAQAARALVYEGAAHSQLGDQEAALARYAEALPRVESSADPGLLLLTLVNQGAAYERLGEAQEALARYRQALDLAGSLGHRRAEAAVVNNLGSLYFSLGDFDEAIAQWRRLAELRRELGNAAGEARAVAFIGQAHVAAGDPRAALGAFETALAAAISTGDRRAEADLTKWLGDAWRDLGEPARALDLYRRARDLAREIEEPRTEAFALEGIALDLDRRGDAEGALEHHRQALAIRRRIAQRGDEAESLARIAELLRRRGDLPAARAAILDALDRIEELRVEVARPDLRQSFFSHRRDAYDFAVAVELDLARERPDEGWAETALATAERGRARTLLDLLTASRVDLTEGVDPELVAAEREAGRRLAAAERARIDLLAGPHDETEAVRREAEVAVRTAAWRDVQGRLRAASPRLATLTDPPALAADGIRGLVDADSVLLEYFLGDGVSAVWAVTADGISVHTLPPRSEIAQTALALRELLMARDETSAGESAQARGERIARADRDLPATASVLTGQVLAPVAARIAGRRIVVVADGALQVVPFAMLPDPGAAGRPLVAGHEIVHLPSASALAALRLDLAGRPPAQRSLALIADPVFSAEDPRVLRTSTGAAAPSPFRRLPFSRREAERIAALAGPEDALLATGFSAARETVASRALAGFRFVHFATHAVIDDRRPELSGLVLSQVGEDGSPREGFLRLLDLYNLRLDADLVSLSACETALGREVRGEGLVGLTRGFFYAGAARVLASLWRVEDRATGELMVRLYRGLLADGLTPAAALRRAQLEMAAEPRWQAPYYWAPFVLQGEWRAGSSGLPASRGIG